MREDCQNALWRCAPVVQQMLLTFGVLITVAAVVIIRRMRAPADGNGKNLGWMSEQWLAEHRASHLP
jgi:hypothetical protein